MNISEFSKELTNLITKELDYDEEKKEIITYGFETVFLSIIGILSVLLVGFIVDALIPSAIAVLFGGFLRKLSGGFHFDSPLKCLAFGAVVYGGIGVLAKYIASNSIVQQSSLLTILVVCLITVGILAPVDCESKPIHSPVFKRKLQMASILFIIVTIIVVFFSDNTLLNTSAVLGIVFQTITLLPILNRRRCNTT